MVERTDVVPSHDSDYVLPSFPLFTRLLTLAHRSPQRPAIRDVNAGIERTHAQLLCDVVKFRRTVKAALSPSSRQGLLNGDETFMSILAPGGYEFAVAVLTVLALGAAPSPLSVVQPVNEASYYVYTSKAVAVLAARSSMDLGRTLEAEISRTDDGFKCIPIPVFQDLEASTLSEIQISSNRYLDINAAGLLIFTSGTTGPPKGAVLRRAAISDGAMSFADQLQLTDQDALLHLLPVHHATGIWVSFFPFLLAGACIEFKSGSFDPKWTWERWVKGGLTHFSGVPTIYMRMMRYFEEHLAMLPRESFQTYEKAPSQFKICMCGTSALPEPISRFWRNIIGRQIIQRYGSTEMGVVFNMLLGDETPDGSVGQATLGVDVKLCNETEGEVLIRSFNMFSKYLHDPVATRAAHDAEGYFHSGDLARREGKYFFIVGRASVDIIKSGGYKISALDVERETLALPYIGEVMVVGVDDEEFGQRVAACVSLRTDKIAEQFYQKHGRRSDMLTINDFRNDLRSRLAGYKLPTVLRVINGELPKSASGKVVKKSLGPQYFPPNYKQEPEVQLWSQGNALMLPKL